MGATAALEVRGLVKRYRAWPARARTALHGIELQLEQGERLALVGPNGSGKSTLLACLAGVERPSAGQVRVLGLPVGTRAARRRIGYAPDRCPFPPELSPRAVLDLLGALAGLARSERRRALEAALDRVGLAHEARHALGGFSAGMRRRFVLAQALFLGPELVLLDEPTAGLDAEGYVVLDECLRELAARGATLVYASHEVAELRASCRRAALLLGGRLVAQGTTEELLADRSRLLALYRALGPASRGDG
ncbi:MAG TPA: ABC transporter ATP-binding protein [Planctomycetota bacterium]